jgi:hypothetical protein
MSRRWEYEDPGEFLRQLETLRRAGVPARRLRVVTPYPVHGMEARLGLRPSPLRYFTLAGALTGLACGFAFPIATVLDWPLMTGGKPLISLPPFVIIAFELTILFGALASLLGFLHLTRLPQPRRVLEPEVLSNAFVIEELEEE